MLGKFRACINSVYQAFSFTEGLEARLCMVQTQKVWPTSQIGLAIDENCACSSLKEAEQMKLEETACPQGKMGVTTIKLSGFSLPNGRNKNTKLPSSFAQR